MRNRSKARVHGIGIACALLVALFATPVTTAEHDDPFCDATPGCEASLDAHPGCRADALADAAACDRKCRRNATAGGETCLHRSRVGITFPGTGVSLEVEEEDTTGSVGLANTPNTWQSDRATVTLAAGDTRGAFTAGLLLSEQDAAGTAPTRQARADVTGSGAGTAFAASGAVYLYNGLPRWCHVATPLGGTTFDCSLDPVRALLP